MFFFTPVDAVRLTVTTFAVMTPSSSDQSERDLDNLAESEDAEIVRKTTLGGDVPRETPDREIPTTGVGSFVVGDDDGEWIESEATVRLEGWR